MNISRSAIMLTGLGLAAVCLFLLIGTRDQVARPTDATPPDTVMQKPGRIATNGLTLASAHVELPDDGERYPAGPHADIVNANCLACHSASMALYQPSLAAADWRKEVEKMRDAYGAPIADKDIPAIVAYFSTRVETRRQ